MKVTGLDKLQKSFKGLASEDDFSTQFLLAVADDIRIKAIAKQARGKGQMIRETTTFKSGLQKVTVAVDTPYAAYNHEGKRADGSRVIRNRTSPGEQFFLQKAALESVPKMGLHVDIIMNEIKKHL
jgi:hypothetical protein